MTAAIPGAGGRSIDHLPSGAEDALDHLVNQFADPLAFLRELVQNSIDAGSAEVEVRCEFMPAQAAADSAASAASAAPPAADPPGTLIIYVDDWGCGMDRQTIDQRLTRLFASDKEGDRTKIGKFGIGFVSVFALRPDAVCVDTGRAGENFRVLFHPDRTFTRIRLPEAIDGTKIQVIKAMPQSEAAQLTRRIKKALRFYCRHVQIELRYAGELLSGPLSLSAAGSGESGDSDVVIELAERTADMHVLVGFTPPQQPDLGGFFNRGLTLLEQPSGIAGISFKVDSPHFSHTLSRDAIIKDAHHQRAMAAVLRLSAGPLREKLCLQLETELRAGAPDERVAPLQQRLAECLQREPLPKQCLQRRCVRLSQGEPVTLAACQLAAANHRLILAEKHSPLASPLAAMGWLVLPSWQSALARALYAGNDLPQAEALYVLPRRPPEGGDAGAAAALGGEVLELLRGIGAAVAAVELGQLGETETETDKDMDTEPPAVAQEKPFTLGERRGVALGAALLRGPRRTLILNSRHATVRALLPLSLHEPELSAYTMAKLCLLDDVLTAELEGRLLTLAIERRGHRLGV